MFDTYITIIGNVLTQPEWRRTTKTNAVVTNFRVASTSRKFDKEANAWVDGDSLRVKVVCWRKLGEHVFQSVMQGDPVIVTGRMYTRDYTTEDGQKRISYELDAVSVGHDLARGTGRFTRRRATTPAEIVDDGTDEIAGIGGMTATGTAIAGSPGEPLDDESLDDEFDPGEALAEDREPELVAG